MISQEILNILIKHPRYKYKTNDIQTRDICMKVRGQHCAENFPIGTAQNKLCMDETRWLCTNGYPRQNNVRLNVVSEYRDRLMKNILAYLKKSKLLVNKQVLDIILSNGFFERVSNRMGNKSKNYINVKYAVDGIMNQYSYYSQLIEGFGKATDKSDKKIQLTRYIPHAVLIALFIILMCSIYKK